MPATRPLVFTLAWLLPVGPLLVLLVVYVLSVRRGLSTRTGIASSVVVERDVIVFHAGRRVLAIPRARIAQVRHARNGNWTESRVVEDAVTMFDAQGRKLAKIPESAGAGAPQRLEQGREAVGFAQLGQESTSQEEMREYFKLIEQDTLRANKILQSLLEFARPPDVELEPIEINDVVNGALQLCRHRLMMMGVRVETSLGESLTGVAGSENQLRQVLLNLMINAGQAMEQSSMKRVTVTTANSSEGGVLLTMADTGPGMSPEVRDSLFKPFFTTKRRGVGTGLGLSVSRGIIEAHRGTIRVDSEPGQGATFVIHLPKRPPKGGLAVGSGRLP